MPVMVQARSGVRPKSPSADKPAKKPTRRQPKSVREVEERLRRLGPYPMVTGPYEADDYDALTRRRLDWMTQRKHLLALKHQLGQKTDNDAIQARSTVEVAVDDPESKRKARKNLTRVKQSEAWRYNQLNGMQRQAETELEQVIRAKLSGPGSLVAKYGSVGGGNDPFTVSAAMDATWKDWRREGAYRGVNVEAVVDCIAQPRTLAEIEQARGMKPGQGLANHQRGLDLWSELRGWTKPHHVGHALNP